MISFPNAKINLGLHVVEKRPDGFHNIETIFYPVSWCDVLEVIEKKGSFGQCVLTTSGIPIDGKTEDNLLVKAYKQLSEKKQLPSVEVSLHKAIPMGAGLGGGSSDAAFFIRMLNELFEIGLSKEELLQEAAKLGSDCAFFMLNKPVFASGKGDQFSENADVPLKGYKIVIIYPAVHSNTKTAYSKVQPAPSMLPLGLELFLAHVPPNLWKNKLVNDFEPSVFHAYPQVAALKEQLYAAGAVYASMSGSGSAVFGIFERNSDLPELILEPSYSVFKGEL